MLLTFLATCTEDCIYQVRTLEGSAKAGAPPSSHVLVEDVGSDVEVHIHCSINSQWSDRRLGLGLILSPNQLWNSVRALLQQTRRFLCYHTHTQPWFLLIISTRRSYSSNYGVKREVFIPQSDVLTTEESSRQKIIYKSTWFMPFANIRPRCNRPFSSMPAPSPHNVDQVSQSV